MYTNNNQGHGSLDPCKFYTNSFMIMEYKSNINLTHSLVSKSSSILQMSFLSISSNTIFFINSSKSQYTKLINPTKKEDKTTSSNVDTLNKLHKLPNSVLPGLNLPVSLYVLLPQLNRKDCLRLNNLKEIPIICQL